MRATSINVDVALRECLAFHEAFRRLGYPAKHIYVAMHGAQNLNGGVVPWSILRSPLLHRPALMMCAVTGFTEAEQREWSELWPHFAVAWNTSMTEAERREIWQGSYVANNTLEFIKTMLGLGHREPIESTVLA